MSPEKSTTSPTKLCPTCGTRLSENATRCLVCGSDLSVKANVKPTHLMQGSRMPELTLSLPAALGFLALFLTIGAALVFFVLRGNANPAADAAQTPTPSATATVTVTPTITMTPTLEPTMTPLPPIDYKVALGDTCISIALAYKVSVSSIISLNDLPAACDNLVVGQVLKIPQPTPTPSPQPSATLDATQQAEASCEKLNYTVAANDTLSSIAANYGVTMAAIKEYNGLASDTVFEGQPLIIPLCERVNKPTPTPTTPPPYPAPNLLLPADGAAFTLANDTVTLQWASVGTLRQNEAYAVTIEDVTAANGQKLVEYVTDTKFIIPSNFRPNDTTPHIIRWWVLPVRQSGTDSSGKPTWEPAGSPSAQRVFTWSGVGAPAATSPATTPTSAQ